MIVPTTGRVVWYQPPKTTGQPPLEQPYAATVAFVHGDRMINISYVDHAGQQHAATSVKLLQDDDALPELGHYASWMPYQKAQAAKAAAAE